MLTNDDLKKIEKIVKGTEERLDAKIKGTEERLDAKIESIEKKLNKKIEETKNYLEDKIKSVVLKATEEIIESQEDLHQVIIEEIDKHEARIQKLEDASIL